jgi:hypothetical protein
MRLLLLLVLSIGTAACGGGGGGSGGSGSNSSIDVTTIAATDITAHSAALNAIIDPNGIGNVYWFRWSSDPGLLGDLGTLHQYISTGNDNGNGDISVSAPINSLASSTTYYFQAWAGTNSPLYDSSGVIKKFTTSYEYARYWIRSYGGDQHEHVSDIINTTDGGYLLAGMTNTFINNPQTSNTDNMWIVKLTGEGAISWQKSIGGAGIDNAYSIVQTTDGNYLIAGRTEINYEPGKANREYKPWLVKLNQQGSILWQKTYTEGSWISLVEASDGSLLLSGIRTNMLTANHDYWLVRLDSYGNILWQYAFDTSQEDLLAAAAPTENGVVLVGSSASNRWLLEVSLSGSITWQGYYNCDITPSSIAALASGGFVVIGKNSNLATSVVRIDGDGTIGWANSYGSGLPRSVIETSSGEIVTAGCVGDISNCYTAAMKLAPDGRVIWRKKYNLYKPATSYLSKGSAYSIRENNSGDLYLAASFPMGYLDNDGQVFVLPPDGALPPMDSDLSVMPQGVACSAASNPNVNIVTTTAVANSTAIGSTQTSYARVLQQAPQ